MNDLKDKKCIPCEGGVPSLDHNEAEKLLAQVSKSWRLEGKKIHADFKFKDFKEAISFVDKVAEVAESEGHHPDIHLNYNKLRLELTTHAIGGLSENDFIVAAKIDDIWTKI